MLATMFVASLLVWSAFVLRIVSEPGNHVGPEPLLAIFPFVVLLVVAWLPQYRQRKGVRALVTAYALFSLLALVGIDRANLLVQYDRWVERGMPDKPCGEIAENFWACDR
jgi:hypothetical protein